MALDRRKIGLSNGRPARPRICYDMLIPIHNARLHVRKCLESVLAYTDPCHKVWLLDDASTDRALKAFLRHLQSNHSHLRLVKNRRNRGFVETLNAGFALSKNDVVALNSDTVVTPGWLEKMDRCRSQRPKAGIVCPLSNNGGHLSIPEPKITANHMARIVESSSKRHYPTLPFAAGFCMLITRDVLNRIGGFCDLFSPGYGEIFDFSLRATSQGFSIVCCDNAYVAHASHGSFRSRKDLQAIRARNDAFLKLLWPDEVGDGKIRPSPELKRATAPIRRQLEGHFQASGSVGDSGE